MGTTQNRNSSFADYGSVNPGGNNNSTGGEDSGLEALASLADTGKDSNKEDPGTSNSNAEKGKGSEPSKPTGKAGIVGLPYTTVSVREPIIDESKTKFVYNFYTPDERLSKEEKGISITSNDFTTRQEIDDANIDLRGIPRLNQIVFSHNPDLYNESLQKTLGGLIRIGSNNLIKKFKQDSTNTAGELILRPDRIIAEGTFANTFYKSATLLETNMDKRVYDFLDTQIFFDEILSNSTQQNNQVEFNDRVDAFKSRKDKSADYVNVNLVRNFINQLSRSGQQVIDAEAGLDFKDSFLLSVRQQSFLTGFRSTLIHDIFKASVDDSTNLFEDELRTMEPFTAISQQKAHDFENSTIVDNNFFNDILGLGFLYDHEIESLTQFDTGNLDYPYVEHVGYVMQKIEVNKEGTIIQNQAKFIGQKNLDEIIDTQVTYGRSYTYKLRSVSAVEYDFLVTAPSGVPMKIRGLFFVGSKNATINLKAIETIPPKPPNFLRFNYERNRGMLIEWNHPHNPQRDIVGYHVYRRHDKRDSAGRLISAMNQPFTLIREINFDKSAIKTRRYEKALLADTVYTRSPRPWYVDTEFNNDSKFIYAVVSFDAHGMTSNYSPQYEVSYERPTNKIVVKTVSKQFAPKAYPNMFFNIDANISDVFKDNFKVDNKKRLTVYFNPDYYHCYKKAIEGAENSTTSGLASIAGATPGQKIMPPGLSIAGQTQNMNLIQTSTEKEEPVYRIHMINIDLQKDEILDICIKDNSFKELEIPKTMFEENNFSFEMIHTDKYQQ